MGLMGSRPQTCRRSGHSCARRFKGAASGLLVELLAPPRGLREIFVSTEQKIKWVFVVNALINWSLSVRGIIDPVGMIVAFGGAPANYTFVIQLWSAFVFMFGCMFWEVSRDVIAKSALIKYNWIEKTLTATAVTLGFLRGEAPVQLMGMIVLTNWIWIPFIAYFDSQLAIQRRQGKLSLAQLARDRDEA